MPRVIAGFFKGLRLVSPAGLNTRPTADRVKEAVFSMLASLPFDLEGARVLDFFAGNGGLALEALSRGAGSAVLADQDRAALTAIDLNLAAARRFRAVDATVIRLSWPRGFDLLPAGHGFDLLLLDPPYAQPALPLDLLLAASARGLASAGAVAVWEQSPAALAALEQAETGPWRLIKSRVWGRRAAALLRHDP
ncbi:MAG: RsmD family RNA methyltransferase [Candidatus Adiutrix sp.]|nr:RsmD family RNA methyltransferase [Candidatus Adiutrix sp.]